MPRYYFHLHGDREKLRDEEGLVLPDGEAAWYQAVRSAREVIRADVQLPCRYETLFIEIADERGAPVDHIPLRDIARYAM
jgi:hypothetical protein